MALIVKDRVKETTATTGTGTITLAGAADGFQSFSVIGDGNTTYYAITDTVTGEWEVGLGTYTTSGTTLSRDTVLESSNAGSLVNFGSGDKDVFVTYPAERAVYLDGAGSAVTSLDVATLGATTANITTANITAGTVTTAPTSANDLANKIYVDSIAAAGLHYHSPVRVESPIALTVTYNNGTAGVGATLTNADTQAALVIDGVTLSANDRVLIYVQTDAAQNGVYTVTDVGSGSTNWVLTRATDADTYAPSNPNSLGQGDAFYVTQGVTGAGELYVCNTEGVITFGTTEINFVQISSAQIYSAGAGLNLTGTEFSIAPYVVKVGNYTANSFEKILADTSGGSFTVTLPASPIAGDQVTVADNADTWGANNLTIDRNGQTIEGLAQDLVCDINSISVQLVYDGSTWSVYTQLGGNGGIGVTETGTQTLTNKTIDFANNTLTGVASTSTAQTLTNKTIAFVDNTLTGVAPTDQPTITGLKETQVAVAASAIDLSLGNYFTKTISGTTTFTVSNVASSGTVSAFVLDLTNGGSATVNWWAGVTWNDATAPTLTSSGRDVLAFFTHDGGTTWNGFVLGKAMA